jgi:multidrug transporter EmrE-like cation transporter
MIAWSCLALSLLATVAAQLFFKQFHRAGRRIHVLVAIALFVLAVPLTVFAARDLGIGRVYIATALTYVLAPIAAGIAFGERLRRQQWLALAAILAGVILYNL